MAKSSVSYKRLSKELSNMSNPSSSPDPDIYLRPSRCPTSSLSESIEAMYKWNALLRGPSSSPYEGGVFGLSISVPKNYPLTPPTLKFLTPIFHPNVHPKTGEVCLDILAKAWSPAWSLQGACRAVLCILSDPEPSSPLNCDAGNMIRSGDTLAFNSTAAMMTKEHATNLNWNVLTKATT